MTPADITAAQRLVLRRRLIRPQALIQPAILSLFALAITVASGPVSSWIDVVLPVVAVFCFVAALCGLTYALMPLHARRAYRQQPSLRQVWQVELSAAGLRAMTSHQDNFVGWTDYIAWSEDGRIILVYQSERLFQFIPDRAVDDATRTVFRACVAGLPRR